jgi:hypothetical protein
MQRDTAQQQSAGNPGIQAWSDDEVNSLHVGLLLFGSKDFYAIKDTLLPHKKVGLCSRLQYSTLLLLARCAPYVH